jgi:hypothetical protein
MSLSEIPVCRLRVDETRLCAWFGQAGVGDALVYHRGLLANDRAPAFSRLPSREQQELGRVARRAWNLASAGLASLVQMRHGPYDYEYSIVVQPRTPKSGDALKRVLAAELGGDPA